MTTLLGLLLATALLRAGAPRPGEKEVVVCGISLPELDRRISTLYTATWRDAGVGGGRRALVSCEPLPCNPAGQTALAELPN